ncbi:MAG: helix-turn-helix transcriptional regulator [Coprobacillus sp.]|nr:helix-turn-helix transcriptional regulator [Coprobacillus sp.]
MMIHAYSELYLNDAMTNVAEFFNYVSDVESLDELFFLFIKKGYAYEFGRGNVYFLNMPPHVLYSMITDQKVPQAPMVELGRSPQYWCGFVLAYYQWYTGLSFKKIQDKLPPSKILALYHPLHEASLEKFVEVANSIVLQKETYLEEYRKYAKLSQKELASRSGVPLKMIQLYEQRKVNINDAPAHHLLRFSRVLSCTIEDLIEVEM